MRSTIFSKCNGSLSPRTYLTVEAPHTGLPYHTIELWLLRVLGTYVCDDCLLIIGDESRVVTGD